MSMICRICYENEGDLISVCDCSGTCKFVHLTCLQQWIEISNATHCEICSAEYRLPKTHACKIAEICSWFVIVLVGLCYGSTIVIQGNPGLLGIIEVFVYNLIYILVTLYNSSTNPDHMSGVVISLLWILSIVIGMMICVAIVPIQGVPYILCILITNILISAVGMYYSHEIHLQHRVRIQHSQQ